VEQFHTDKKENQIFLIYREIQSRAVAKSYITNGLLTYGEIFAHFLRYQEALLHIWLCNCSTLNFPIYDENLIFFFISATTSKKRSFYSVFAAMSINLEAMKYFDAV
jgi:hypothetical protein